MHKLARLLRHEIGDLLQSVYSTVAVLIERLPLDQKLERRLIADLKNRAELCKGELEAIVDLAAPLEATPDRVDLPGVLGAVLAQVGRRFPTMRLQPPAGGPVLVTADSRTLTNGLWLLFVALCQSAQQKLEVNLRTADGVVECRIDRDGYPATPEQLAWLTQPFATTQHALFGIGLALVQRSVHPGGEVVANNRDDGGVSVLIRFPVLASG